MFMTREESRIYSVNLMERTFARPLLGYKFIAVLVSG